MTSIHEKHQRSVIIHGHFYQPPRENPWLGFIERQHSAAPFNHWTERIAEECYRANAFSPLLARGGRIAALVNNFEYFSFNVGPTLMDWLEPNAPDVYQRIIEGDRRSTQRLGHGNALAQGYNHAILPLCTRQDKKTQILWGLEDFRRRFGRRSRGIWLPETAVDLETVEVLIESGVEFAVLAPSQIEATRALDRSGDWETVPDTGMAAHHLPYRLFGRERTAGHLDVFLFHPDLSREISFDHLLRDGRTFGQRLEQAFDNEVTAAQVLVVVTDGETFGHHEPFGNMCLSWVFSQPADKRKFRLSNFGHFLEHNPPLREARLHPGPDSEGTAWSCAHGVGRWTRDCGCATGAEEGWNQQWRTPLRDSLNLLRDRVQTVLRREEAGRPGPPPSTVPAQPPAPTPHGMSEAVPEGPATLEQLRADALTELHYYGQLMFTSCGWFFNDISGLEPAQNLLYARRVVELLEGHFGEQAEEAFLNILRGAKSNLPDKGHGARIYRREVLPRTLSTAELVASAALLIRFGVDQPLGRFGDHRLEPVAAERISRGSLTLEAGWSRLRSRLSPMPRPFCHLVLLTEDGGCRAWAEAVEGRKADDAYRDLLASLAHCSEENLLQDYAWCVHRGKPLPPAMANRLEARLLSRQQKDASGWMQELQGSGRALFVRAARDREDGSAGHPSPAETALSRLYGVRVTEALERGGRTAHRPAMGMLRMARALALPLDTSAGDTAMEQALGRQLDHPDLFRHPGPARQALKDGQLALRMGLDPAGHRHLQIRFWNVLEIGLGDGAPVPGTVSGILRLAEMLGFHRRSLEKRIRETRQA
jgi:hypothetical protein